MILFVLYKIWMNCVTHHLWTLFWLELIERKSSIVDLWRSNNWNFVKMVMKQIKMQCMMNITIFLSSLLDRKMKNILISFFQIFHFKMEIHLSLYGIVILAKTDSIKVICSEDRKGLNNCFQRLIRWNFRWTIFVYWSKNVQPYILQIIWTTVHDI